MSSLVKGSQAIYGWVEKGSKKGHQLVTKSAYVDDIDLQFLENHSLPASLDNTTFKECRRFFNLPDGKFAFNYIKNIGKDTYGREGALLSHFIIMDFENLKNLGKNFDLVDEQHLKGINSVNDLLKLKVGNDFLTLPEITIDVENDGKKQFPEGTTKEMIFPLLLSMYSGKKKLVLKKGKTDDLFSVIINLENLFPGAISFTYSTFIYDFIADEFVDIGGTGLNARIPPETYVINMDNSKNILMISRGGYWENLEVVRNDNSILWQFAILLERYGKEILESMYSRIDAINQYNTMETMFEEYLKMLAETYFDFLISGEMDLDSGITAIFNAMENRMILPRDKYLERIMELMKEHPDKIPNLMELYFDSFKNSKETSDMAMKLREIVSIVLRYAPNPADVEKFVSLYLKEPGMYKSDIMNGTITNEASKPENKLTNVSYVFSLIPETFEEWYRIRMKERLTLEELDQALNLMASVKNSSKQMFSLYMKVIEETLKRNPSTLEKFIEILEKYHTNMRSEDVSSLCKTLISDLSKSSIKEADQYIQRLEMISGSNRNSKNNDMDEEKKQRRGFFGRKKE
ncbi:hypothetical protein ACNF40_00920 [Cuniculiplasma sp. SKW4]|uniref:hypothetical protein n=1 Tax=Cuniculiplasma sp. SKW4 TaxID=3400171 RepID=UPI003FD1DCB9